MDWIQQHTIATHQCLLLKLCIYSDTDTMGATDATHTTFYFAEGDSRQDSTRNYSTFITVLNPSSTQTAHVTITYYSGGKVMGTEPVSVGPLQRGTGAPAALALPIPHFSPHIATNFRG